MRAFTFPIMAAATLLGGCTTFGKGPLSEPATVPAEAVIRQIKSDLGSYFAYQHATANAPAQNNACQGRVGFKVASITVALTTLTEVSTSGEASAEIPIGGIKLGPSGSYSRGSKSSQTLSFTVQPMENQPGSRMGPPRPNSFDAVLRSLRESLLRASDTQPCLKFPDAKDQDNAIEFGFTVTRDSSVGGEISFLIFSLGAERSRSFEAANTVTVKFIANEGTVFVQ